MTGILIIHAAGTDVQRHRTVLDGVCMVAGLDECLPRPLDGAQAARARARARAHAHAHAHVTRLS